MVQYQDSKPGRSPPGDHHPVPGPVLGGVPNPVRGINISRFRPTVSLFLREPGPTGHLTDFRYHPYEFMPDRFFDPSLVERPRSAETAREGNHHRARRAFIGKMIYVEYQRATIDG